MATILDGKWLSEEIQRVLQSEVADLLPRLGERPGLGVILVGDNPASRTYVANKEKLARRCGLETFDARLPETATFAEVQSAIQSFNNDPRVHGVLLQLPLPAALRPRTNELLDLILPTKDADGLHPLNQGLMMRGEGTVLPCTPLGSMYLIDLAFSAVSPTSGRWEDVRPVDLSGKRAVVVGRSILVGRPVGIMLLERNATVLMAHSKSPDLPALCREADILVAAVGVPNLVQGSWVKPGAVVIDVGINRLPSGKLTGDVEFAGVVERAAAVTPVPGGVGPMTVAMLIRNTVKAWRAQVGTRQ